MRFVFCGLILACLLPAAELSAGERGAKVSLVPELARQPLPGREQEGNKLARLQRARGGAAGASALKKGVFRPVLQQRERPPGRRPGRRTRPLPPPRLMERLKNLSPQEQEKVLRNNRRFQQLPKQRRDQLLRRLRRFRELSPEQKEQIKQRYRNFSRLTPEQRQKAREIYRQHWRTLSRERRRTLMQEFRRLRRMSPNEQEEYLARPEMQRRFSTQERELLREVLKELNSLPLPPRSGGPPSSER